MGKWTSAARKLRAAMDTACVVLTDEQALDIIVMFPMWSTGAAYAVGDRVQYNRILYKCIQAHTSQSDWMPSATPALWKTVSVDEYPEWVQPTGAHDAYNIGDKVTYNGKHYVCTSNANVYAPDVCGWELVNNG